MKNGDRNLRPHGELRKERQGYQLTRWADDWVVTCRTRAEAEHALVRAVKILEQLGVALNLAKTRIVYITHGFEFLGFKIQRGKGKFRLTADSDSCRPPIPR